MKDLFIFFKNIDPQFYTCIFGLVVTGIGIYNPLLLGLYSPDNNYNESVNDTLRMYKNDDIRMYNSDCITDTIVEVITTCNTYTLLTVHLL